jgi:hypothetical protein
LQRVSNSPIRRWATRQLKRSVNVNRLACSAAGAFVNVYATRNSSIAVALSTGHSGDKVNSNNNNIER